MKVNSLSFGTMAERCWESSSEEELFFTQSTFTAKSEEHDGKYLLSVVATGGFHVTSSPPCWWTKTIDLSLAPFVRPPAFVHFTIVICVSRDWLKTTYSIGFA